MQQATVIQPRLITLILLNGLAISSLNLFLPSLPGISVEFETSYALVNLSIAGYAAMTAVLQLVVGPMSDRFGRRPVILSSLLVFSLASLGCLLATDIASFLFFRMMQAAIISAHTVSYAVIRDSAQERKAASLMGYVAMAWAIAPMLAPVLGGTLDELFGWRASFWAFLLFGTAIFGLCLFDLHETNIHPSKLYMSSSKPIRNCFAPVGSGDMHSAWHFPLVHFTPSSAEHRWWHPHYSTCPLQGSASTWVA